MESAFPAKAHTNGLSQFFFHSFQSFRIEFSIIAIKNTKNIFCISEKKLLHNERAMQGITNEGQLPFKLNSKTVPWTLLLYLIFISYLPLWTLQDFPPVFSLASLPFLSCSHRPTTKTNERSESVIIKATQTEFCLNYNQK